jgi:hypothetical protein
VITHPWILVGIYALLPLALLLSGFRARSREIRLILHVLSGLLAVPLVLIGVLAVLYWQAEPPSLRELARDFPARRSDLEELLRITVENPSDPAAVNARYDRIGARLGMRKDLSGDVFVMMDSIGLLNRGHITGYLHCTSDASQSADRYPPCVLKRDNGEQEYNDQPRKEAYSFQRLEGQWFAYSEGPS